jgi:hypothetical protein
MALRDKLPIMGSAVRDAFLLGFLLLGPAIVAQAQPRRARGIYAVVNIEDAINAQTKANPSVMTAQLDASFDSLYQGLLANAAVSGLTLQDSSPPNHRGQLVQLPYSPARGDKKNQELGRHRIDARSLRKGRYRKGPLRELWFAMRPSLDQRRLGRPMGTGAGGVSGGNLKSLCRL